MAKLSNQITIALYTNNPALYTLSIGFKKLYFISCFCELCLFKILESQCQEIKQLQNGLTDEIFCRIFGRSEK